jgi:hypothetical protein
VFEKDSVEQLVCFHGFRIAATALRVKRLASGDFQK